MRLVFRFLAPIVLLSLGNSYAVASPAAALPVQASQTTESPLKKEAVQPASILPHRATYAMTLASVKNGSNITDVSGTMAFEWRDVCTGWAIQQHMQLHFAYAEGKDQQTNSAELTWESKDGKRYTFNIHHANDGQPTEIYRGSAMQNTDGTVTVTYDAPDYKVVNLPAGTLFPSAHTELLLQKAAQAEQKDGEKFFSRRIFDGSDKVGSSDISAFVMPQRPLSQASDMDSKLKKNPLLTEAAWPIHLAFFNPDDDETGEPDYEMDLALLPNGIARHMKIDYGDFAVVGTLTDVHPLPAQRCP